MITRINSFSHRRVTSCLLYTSGTETAFTTDHSCRLHGRKMAARFSGFRLKTKVSLFPDNRDTSETFLLYLKGGRKSRPPCAFSYNILLEFFHIPILSASFISSSLNFGWAIPMSSSALSQVVFPFRSAAPYSVTI